MENALKLWEQVKDMLKASNDEATFNQTFAPITDVYKVQNNIIYLIVNNSLDIFSVIFIIRFLSPVLQQGYSRL